MASVLTGVGAGQGWPKRNKRRNYIMVMVYTKYRGTLKYNELYEKLKETARARSTITYGEVAEIMGHPGGPNMGANMGRIIGAISEDEYYKGKPMLSAVVVRCRRFCWGRVFID